MTRDEIVYLAGIIDGEGSVTIVARDDPRTTRTQFQPRVLIFNTNAELMDWIQERFGGTLLSDPARPGRRTCYRLIWAGRRVIELLYKVRPFLIIKAERATVVIDGWRDAPKYVGNQHPLPQETWCKRKMAYIEIRRLNVNGSNRAGTRAPIREGRIEGAQL